MFRVYLIRHGKAEPWSDSGTDADRPLRSRGEKQARWLGERLASCDGPPVRVLSSGAVRAWETATRIGAALGIEAEEDARLGLAASVGDGVDAIEEAFVASGDGGSIALVGHNPTMSMLVARLVRDGGGAGVELRTGACVAVDVDGASPVASGTLLWEARRDG